MWLKRMMQFGSKALRVQNKRMPNKRFKDDDGTELSFADIADQIDAFLEFIYESEEDLYIERKDENTWIVTRKEVPESVRNNRHRNNRA